MDWDYIIVGGGTAGCVLANRLTERRENRVLVLESGGRDWSPYILIPGGMVKTANHPKLDWRFVSEPDPSLNNRSALWPRGRVLGGSSSINGMVYVRGNRADYDRWATLGNRGWSYDDVLPYFRKSETNDFGASQWHGADGPMRVSRIASPHPLTKVFVEAGVELGFPLNPDFNGEHQEGVGHYQGTIGRGRRSSTARAYLAPVRNRRNLKIETHALVRRLVLDGNRVVGVEYEQRGTVRTARASAEVILAAGSLMSPLILMRSGIGPAVALQKHGIDIVHDAPGVGQNLQEHPVLLSSDFVSVPTYNNDMALWKWPMHGLNWLLFGRGPAATQAGEGGGFVKSSPDLELPDIQFHFTPLGYQYQDGILSVSDRPAVTVCINVLRPMSRHSLSLRSADPHAAPVIRSNLMEAESDLKLMVAGIRIKQRLLATRAFAPYFAGRSTPPDGIDSDEQLEAYVREVAGPGYHPVGTCKMGTDAMAVVDETLRVRGLSGLRIVDASIMPDLPGGNTNAAVVMIAEKGADMILKGS